MEVSTADFKRGAAATIRDPQRQRALHSLYEGLHKNRIDAAAATENWEELRDRGRAIRWHAVNNLDHYLELLERNVAANGGNVFFASDAAEATSYVADVARRGGVKTVIKSKSMVSEEMGINPVLEAAGMEVVETDLGEYIIQLAKEPPYHLIAPAIHKSRDQVADLLAETTGGPRQESAEELTATARGLLRTAFERAEMGISGVNFAVAETGSIALVTNEGNGRMVTSAARIHVAIMGLEKVIPSMADLSTMLRILIRSATGQVITTYVTIVNGPRTTEEEDGPDEFHLVIVDNGRHRLLRDPQLREALLCIRCGACLNACPVYRKVGGHSYGWVYPGPIGAIVSPMLSGLKQARDLPYASTLCGACREVCPVKIDLPGLLLRLRGELADGLTDPGNRRADPLERASFRLWRTGMLNARLFGLAGRAASIAMLPLSFGGWIRWLPPPLRGWTRSRDFKRPAFTPFRARIGGRRSR